MNCITCNDKQRHLTEDLYLCNKCGLVSSNVLPDLTLYDKLYSVQYSRLSHTRTGEILQALRHSFIKDHIKRPTPTLLDFGCGYGNFIDTCNSNGIRASGFDINPYSNFCVIETLLKSYDAVTFWDSLEHLRDPLTVIKRFNTDWVFISTPSLDDLHGGLIRIPKWNHYKPGEHVHYFSLKSLTALLIGCGYEIISHNYKESNYRKAGGDRNILTIGAKRIG